jgi:hypothetical protein
MRFVQSVNNWSVRGAHKQILNLMLRKKQKIIKKSFFLVETVSNWFQNVSLKLLVDG